MAYACSLFLGTVIFGIDPITAWKDIIKGTIIETYYGMFTVAFFVILILVVAMLKKA